ncbi:MAG: septum formation initiator family protein [Deltaproteobacteria bacterium]|nr:septum formation initiator family protein [Deltaproteobacteria bacterium]
MHRITPLVLLLMTFSVVFFTVQGKHGVRELLRMFEYVDLAKQEDDKLQREIFEVKEKMHRVREDDFYLEKIAREELGLAKPRDVVYILPSTEGESQQ